MNKEILLSNIDKVHTTEMGIDRIKKNLKLNTSEEIMDKNFKKMGTINYKNGKYANVFMIGNFIFFVLIGIVFIILNNSVENNTIKSQWFLLGCILYIILHEITHLIFMKIFSKEKINISIKFPTISVGSNAKYSKKQFSIIALAPVIILGIILILLILFSSKDYTFLWSILLTLNFAGSGGDFLQFLKISKYPTNTYFQDTSNETIVFQ
jgi:uncharacterized integral membrane protein